ncbi:hypothetical protein D3C76_1413600 [compost metagenome]
MLLANTADNTSARINLTVNGMRVNTRTGETTTSGINLTDTRSALRKKEVSTTHTQNDAPKTRS